jgi:hypothetical protein
VYRRIGCAGYWKSTGRVAQVRGDHYGSARIERHPDARHRGADARVLGDAAATRGGMVLRHVQISADKYAFARRQAFAHHIGKPEHFHGLGSSRLLQQLTTRTISSTLFE